MQQPTSRPPFSPFTWGIGYWSRPAALGGSASPRSSASGQGSTLSPVQNRALWLTRYTASRKGLPFRLSIKKWKELTALPCHYCGAPPTPISPAYFARRKGGEDVGKVNGLDRIDSRRGYVLDNVVPCCVTCNRMKSDFSAEEFIIHIKQVTKWQSIKASSRKKLRSGRGK